MVSSGWSLDILEQRTRLAIRKGLTLVFITRWLALCAGRRPYPSSYAPCSKTMVDGGP